MKEKKERRRQKGEGRHEKVERGKEKIEMRRKEGEERKEKVERRK